MKKILNRGVPLSLPWHSSGVTLMELLLVVAVVAIIAPIAVPPLSSGLSANGDLATTHQLIDMVSHTRTMGLMGRTAESVIAFTNNSASLNRGGSNVTLPDGFTVGGFKVNGAAVTNLSVAFAINGNIACNGAAANNASVDLKRGGATVSTINMNGIGIPVPDMTASVDPANPSGSAGRRCRWF